MFKLKLGGKKAAEEKDRSTPDLAITPSATAPPSCCLLEPLKSSLLDATTVEGQSLQGLLDAHIDVMRTEGIDPDAENVSDTMLSSLFAFVARFNERFGEDKHGRKNVGEVISIFPELHVTPVVPTSLNSPGELPGTSEINTSSANTRQTSSEGGAVVLSSTPTRQLTDLLAIIAPKTAAAMSPLPKPPVSVNPTEQIIGHPHNMVLFAIQGLKEMVKRLSGLLSDQASTVEQEQTVQTMHHSVLILRHIEILSIYNGNRDSLIMHSALDLLVTALDISGAAIIRLDDSDMTPSYLHHSSDDLGNLAICCMNILTRIIDPELRWRRWIRSGGESIPILSTSTSSRATLRLDSKFYQRLTEIVTTMLFYLADTSIPPSSSSFAVRIAALTTLGSLLAARPTTVRRHLLKNDGISKLTELIRPPLYLNSDNINSVSPECLRSEFRCQVLVWSTIQFLTRISVTSLKRIEELDGFKGVSYLFLWVSWLSGKFGSEGDEQDFYPDFTSLSDLYPLKWKEAFTLFNSSAGVSLAPNIELKVLYGYSVAMCRFNGNPIDQDPADSVASPLTVKAHKSGKPNVNDAREKEANSELSQHVERMLKILIRTFNEDLAEVPEGFQEPSDVDVVPLALRVGFLLFVKAVLLVDDPAMTSFASESKDHVSTRRRLFVGWMDALSDWKLLISPKFYFHRSAALSGALRASVTEVMLQAGTLPHVANFGIVTVLVEMVSKFDNDCSTEERILACKSLVQISEMHNSYTMSSLVKCHILDHFLPLVDPNLPDDDLKTCILDVLKLCLHGGPNILAYIGNDKSARVTLAKWYSDRTIFAIKTKSERHPICDFILDLTGKVLSTISGSYCGPASSDENLHNQDDTRLSVDTSSIEGRNVAVVDFVTWIFGLFVDQISTTEALEFQISVLNDIRYLLRSYPPGSTARRRVRHGFISSRLFEHLLSVLSVNISIHATDTNTAESQDVPGRWNNLYHTLCASVISTMGVALTGSEISRKKFRELQGYEEIISRILVKGGWAPWPELISLFFGLLVPQWMPTREMATRKSPIVIRNQDMILTLINLQAYVPEEMTLEILERLEELAIGHEMNRVILSRAGLSMLLLKRVLPTCRTIEHIEKTVSLFQVVANYSITVAEAKALFRLCRPIDPDASERSDCFAGSTDARAVNYGHQTPRMSRRLSASLIERKNPTSVWSQGPYLPLFYDPLLKAVRKLSQRKDADLDFFYFSGRLSGIVLPRFSRWPAGVGGYSFFTWIKMEQVVQNDNDGSDHGVISLFSIRNSDGSGVELSTQNSSLTLEVSKGGKSFSLTSDYKLSNQRWYFIAVSHTAAKFPWFGPSEAIICVNGNIKTQGKLEYPEIQDYRVNRVGCSGLDFRDIAPVTKFSKGPSFDSIPDVEDDVFTPDAIELSSCFSCFSGQMSSVYVLDDALTLPQISALHELGPGHSSQFKAEDALSYPEMDKSLFDGTLSPKIFLHLYPTAVKSRWSASHCYDVSQKRLGKAEMKDVLACSTKCLRTAIHALGGVSILLPLVTHLDYPVGSSFNESKMVELTDTPVEIRTERLSSFLRVVGVLIGDDLSHCERFAAVRGPKLISLLLQHQNPGSITMASLDTMMALSKVVSGVSAPFASDLESEILDSLVFDFKLWAVTGPSVQLDYIQFLKSYLSAQTDALRGKYGVPFIMDIIETYYWNTPPDFLPPDLLARLILGRPDTTHISMIRSALFEVIGIFVAKGIMPEELSRIVGCLWLSKTDPSHVCDIIQFLMKCCFEGPNTAVLETLTAQGTLMELLLWLITESQEAKIRVLALKFAMLILKLERTPEKVKRRIRLEELPGEIFTPASSSAMSLTQTGCSFARLIRMFPFTKTVYLCLLQLCLEEQILDWDSDAVLFPLQSMENPRFKNISYLAAIFDLLRWTPNLFAESIAEYELFECRSMIVNDLISLTTSRPLNSETVRKIYGWQALLFDVIPPNIGSEISSPISANNSDCPGSGNPTSHVMPLRIVEEAVFNFAEEQDKLRHSIAELVAIVVYDAFEGDRRAWKLLEETLVFCLLSRRVGGKDRGILMLRAILLNVLRHVRREIGMGHAGIFSSVKTENIWHMVLLAEEFLFNNHDMLDSFFAELEQIASNPTGDSSKVIESDAPSVILSLAKFRKEKKSPAVSRRNSSNNDIAIQISYPFEESPELAEEILEVLSSFIDFGITHVQLTDTTDKSHMRVGGLVRVELRVLLSALVLSDERIWLVALPHFLPLIDKHAKLIADSQSRQRILHIIATIHNAFICDSAETNLDRRLLLPLYMLAVNRWKDVLSTVKLSDVERLASAPITEEETFLKMIYSEEWQSLYDNHLFSAMKQVDQEDFEFVPLSTKRFVKVVKSVLLKWRKEELAIQKSLTVTGSHVKMISSRRSNEECARMSERGSALDSDRRMNTRQWLSKYRELTQERAIWALPISAEAQRWKLDRMENFSRMRPRLARNYDFDSHSDAAARRDKVNITGLDSPAVQSSPRIERAMMAHTVAAAMANAAADRRKAQVEKLRMHFEAGSTADLMREVSEGSIGTVHHEEDLEDDEWNLIADGDNFSSNFNGTSVTTDESEKLICAAECEMILLMTAVKGRLELTSAYLSFRADLRGTAAELSEADQRILVLSAESEVLLKERRWPLSHIREVFLRRYMLRKSALEVFFIDRTNYLFNFKQSKDRLKILSKIVQLRPPNLVTADARSPEEILKRTTFTEKWQKHEISNFEYLMLLNTISGRTYNDLTQYPVFPWLIVDYTSKTLDLNDPSIYRDLSKPVGALNEVRLEQYLDRFRQFEDPSGSVKKFLYGTHYSTSAAVLFYLLRLEPFASLHIALQGGKFDHPDRQFHSMEGCWNSVFSGNSDVKELIPEFFYMPEFLVNENKFDLGRKQTGALVDDVILPEWASTPEEFIRIHREALEGDYVSEHLHEWIDLIWGYKQTGEEAAKANNVFYYLTYEGAIDIELVKDPIEKKSIEDQINNFGQTPSQLFNKPHPKRLKRSNIARQPLFATPQSHKSYLVQLKGSPVFFVSNCKSPAVDRSTAAPRGGFFSGMVGIEKQQLVTVDSFMTVGLHRWSSILTSTGDQSFQFELDPGVYPKRAILSHFASNIKKKHSLFASSLDGRYVFSAGHWDGSFHMSAIETPGAAPRSVEVVYGHHDVVTCLSISEDGRALVTGSRDTTSMAWDLLPGPGDSLAIRQENYKVFYGHDDEVTSVAINVEHDLVITGSKDGTCIIHALHEAKYLRTVRPTGLQRIETITVQMVRITKQATIIIYSEELNAGVQPLSNDIDNGSLDVDADRRILSPLDGGMDEIGLSASEVSFIHAYSINGSLIRHRMFTWRCNDIAITHDGIHMVCADNKGGILLMITHTLQISHRFDVAVTVLSVALSENDQQIFLGRQDGRLLCLTLGREDGKDENQNTNSSETEKL